LYEFIEAKDSTMHEVKGELVRTDNALKNYSKLRAAGFDITI